MSHFFYSFLTEMMNDSKGPQMEGGLRGLLMEQEEKSGERAERLDAM